MTELQLRLPDHIHREAKRLAAQQHVSLNQFLVTSVSNELMRLECRMFFAPIAEQFDEGAFQGALAAVPDVPPERGDDL